MRRSVYLTLVILGLFALDQGTKILAYQTIQSPIEVTGFFNLILTLNRGVSFAMLTPHHIYGVYLLIALTSLLTIFVLYMVVTSQSFLDKIGFSMVFSGAAGNLLDRIRLGGVIDFLDFHLAGYHWPAFNVADTSICIGVGLLFLNQFILKQKVDKKGAK